MKLLGIYTKAHRNISSCFCVVKQLSDGKWEVVNLNSFGEDADIMYNLLKQTDLEIEVRDE